MNRLPLLLVSLLVVPPSASAAPLSVKAAPSSARPDLLSSVRSHAAALGRHSVALPGVGIRGPAVTPPAFASPRPEHLVTVIAAAPVSGHR